MGRASAGFYRQFGSTTATSHTFPATLDNRATARFARVNLQPQLVVAANVIGKVVAHTFKGFLRLFARAIKHVTYTAHDPIVTAALLVSDIPLAPIFHHRIHRRAGKHSFGARNRSLVCTNVNRAYGPAILILQSKN